MAKPSISQAAEKWTGKSSNSEGFKLVMTSKILGLCLKFSLRGHILGLLGICNQWKGCQLPVETIGFLRQNRFHAQ